MSTIKHIMPVLFLIQFSLFTGHAQERSYPAFKNGDRICFVGNSITTQGYFHYFINLYYATRFPEAKIAFYNCGIIGNVAQQILARVDSDVLIHHPTCNVLMVGMNDVNRDLYKPGRTGLTVEASKRKAIAVYRQNLDLLVQRLKAKAGLILLRPSIYDQTSQMSGENLVGVNDALGQCCHIIDSLGNRYNIKVVDFWSLMLAVNQQIQQKNPASTIVGSDRVHPGMPGHFVMAYQFIKSTCASAYVSDLTVDSHSGNVDCNNCSVKKLKKASNGDISFVCTEKSLPFPVQDGAMPALSWVPFQQELNREMVRIKQQPAGYYDCYIDSTRIGRFSERELEQGIDLSRFQQTPQYQQAIQVRKLLEKRATLQNLVRRGKYAEYNYLVSSGLKDIKDSLKVSQYLATQLQTLKGSPRYDFMKSNFESYLNYGLTENRINTQVNELNDDVYVRNRPVPHHYRFVKVTH